MTKLESLLAIPGWCWRRFHLMVHIGIVWNVLPDHSLPDEEMFADYTNRARGTPCGIDVDRSDEEWARIKWPWGTE